MSWNARSKTEDQYLRNFFIRRFFRIAPLFYLAIIFYVTLYGLGPRYYAPNGVQWWFIPLTGIFAHGFHPETITSVIPGGWSIAVEMTFYLALPLLLSVISNLRIAAMILGPSILLYIAGPFAITRGFADAYPFDQNYLLLSFANMNFFAQLPVFILGISIYYIFKEDKLKKPLAIFSAVLLPVIILIFTLMPDHRMVLLLSNYLVVSLGLAAFTIMLSEFPVFALVNPAICFLGKISFSLYLTHFAIIDFLQYLNISEYFSSKHNDAWFILHYILVVWMSCIPSYLTFTLIEKRGIQLGRS